MLSYSRTLKMEIVFFYYCCCNCYYHNEDDDDDNHPYGFQVFIILVVFSQGLFYTPGDIGLF